MKAYYESINILKEIINNHVSFHLALKKSFEDKDGKELQSSDISALCGCYLRHYIVFNNVLSSKIEQLNDNLRYALGLILANGLFLKRFSKEESFEFLNNFIKENNINFDIAIFEEIYKDKVENNEPLIISKFEKDSEDYNRYLISTEFISQRFNIPEWIYKMWKSQFGTNKALKTVKCLQKYLPNYLLLNTNKNNKAQLLDTYKNELLDTDYEDIVKYVGKEPIRRKKYLVANKVAKVSLILKEIMDGIDIDVLKSVYFYLGTINNIFLNYAFKYNNNLAMDIFITPNKDLFSFKTIANRYQIKNVNFIECEPSALITGISNKSQLFVVMPESSNLYRLKGEPDYFLVFKQDSLDQLIENERNTLSEASKFVEDGGYLLYAVNTLNKKEGETIIFDFINKNKEFTIEKQRQVFPYENEGEMMFVALLKKGSKIND